MIDGDLEKVIANQGIFIEAQKKSAIADSMRGTPRPAAGGSDGDGRTGLDYDKLIQNAYADGNNAAAAYYTRLKAMDQAQV